MWVVIHTSALKDMLQWKEKYEESYWRIFSWRNMSNKIGWNSKRLWCHMKSLSDYILEGPDCLCFTLSLLICHIILQNNILCLFSQGQQEANKRLFIIYSAPGPGDICPSTRHRHTHTQRNMNSWADSWAMVLSDKFSNFLLHPGVRPSLHK